MKCPYLLLALLLQAVLAAPASDASNVIPAVNGGPSDGSTPLLPGYISLSIELGNFPSYAGIVYIILNLDE